MFWLILACKTSAVDSGILSGDTDPPIGDTGCELSTWYDDDDGDGWGDPATGLEACEQPEGYTAQNGDCDDDNESVSPKADEACNGIDDDCDGLVDDADPELEASSVWYEDSDGDGVGNELATVTACLQPSGHAATSGDCDDEDATRTPGADELCDGIDNDCSPDTSDIGTVSSSGVAYATIQAALDDAEPGAVVTVCRGTFYEALSVERDVVLEALAGAALTVIDAAQTGAVIEVVGAALTLSGFTLTGGTGATYDDGTTGGGIAAVEATSLSVADCIISGNTARWGGGVAGSTGTDTFTDTKIEDNVATSYGGGLFLFQGSLDGVTVGSNVAPYGGGIHVEGGAVDADANTRVTLNTGTTLGGGASVGTGGALTGGIFDSNTASSGGGVALGDNSSLQGASLTDNGADGYGGGIYADGSVSIDAVLLNGGTAAYGAGAYVTGAAALTDVTITDNVASTSGGGLFLDGADVLLDGVGLSANDAESGGGIYALSSAVNAIDSDLTDHLAVFGGGMVVDSSVVAWSGGSMTGNTASDAGGAIYFFDISFTASKVGMGGSGNRNSPEDAYLDFTGESYTWYASTTVSCTASLCAEP